MFLFYIFRNYYFISEFDFMYEQFFLLINFLNRKFDIILFL